MKTVILAAGVGKRFKGLDIPKPLTLLANGKSILGLQIETLSHYISLDELIIIVGYHKEKIMEQFPNLLYVYNPDFSEENTAKSLLRAFRKIHEDVLWLNGDVVFHPSALEALLACQKSCMLVNKAPVGNEEVKYKTDSQGRIREVSKQILESQGEALGLNFFKAQDLEILKKNLAMCHKTDYFEKGIELSIQQGASVWSVPVLASQCTEIDFPEDLNRANEILWD